ncbi:MAG: CoA pyrophosphatase [Proteobacteria bacterium]|nr:CoA pyrophosphatase [Pseudomonadota bacterium]
MHEWEKRLRERLKPVEAVLPELGTKILASVLVPIGARREAAQHEILLTKRSERVETHKGQVSFPGGLFEPCDRHLLQTALRETYEEVGIHESRVEILGSLAPVQTLQDVEIYPWVAKVDFPEKFEINPDEVEKTIFLPLEKLLTDGLKPVQVSVKEEKVSFTVTSLGVVCDNELIWGASAKILEQLWWLLK